MTQGMSRLEEKSGGILPEEEIGSCVDGEGVDRQALRWPPASHLSQGEQAKRIDSAPIRNQILPSTRRASHVQEKTFPSQQPIQISRSLDQSQIKPVNTNDGYDLNDDDDEGGCEIEEAKRHALWILIYLSTLAPLLALPIALYTILASTILLLLHPLCFFANKQPLSNRLYRFVSPPPLFQLGLIFSSHNEEHNKPPRPNGVIILIFVNIFAPIYALCITLAAWVAAVFWLYTSILGNPDGKEDSDDGREAVLAVMRWWEKWLAQGLA